MRLPDDLATIAQEAGPLSVEPEAVASRVRRRRRWSVVGASAGAAVLTVGAVLVGTAIAPGPDGSTNTPAVTTSYPRPFICGEELYLGPGVSDTQLGLTMALSKVAKVSNETGPALEVTFTSAEPMEVRGGPRKLYQVMYVRDNLIVGGGPYLNPPGDMSDQVVPLIGGGGFDVGPGAPFTRDLEPRNELCPGLTWPEVWREAQAYEAVLIGEVSTREAVGFVRFLAPYLGSWPLIADRAHLTG